MTAGREGDRGTKSRTLGHTTIVVGRDSSTSDIREFIPSPSVRHPGVDISWWAGGMAALVESPLQLLCAVETHAAGHAGPRTDVLARADVASLGDAVDAVRVLGLPEGLTVDIRRPHGVRAVGGVGLVGDPFSGVFQADLTRGMLPDLLVIVDDGLGSLDAAFRLVRGEPMIRMAAPSGPLRRWLGSATTRRLRRMAREGRVRICTMLPVDDELSGALRELGVDLVRHAFDWLASRPHLPARETIEEETVVVGSGLVADHLVHADDYAAWLHGLATDGPVRYVPHRRHDPLVTASFSRLPGVRVDEPGAPVEIRLRSLHAGQRVVSLPSTSAVTLTRLLSTRGVDVRTHHVPDSWWTPVASPRLREHLATAADLAATTRRQVAEESRRDTTRDTRAEFAA